MPAQADTRVPARASSPRLARFVLLAALAAGLGGLGLTGGASATTLAAPALDAPSMSSVLLDGVPDRAAVRSAAAIARTQHPRANRSRAVVSAPQWVRPVWAGIVSPYGPRWGGFHPGDDFGAGYGTPVETVGTGVVVGAGWLAGEGGYGEIVLVRHSPDVVTAYAHLSRCFVSPGQLVHTGDVIGLVGATGDATGPHLHFEVRIDGVKVNPVPWLRAHGVWV